MEIKKKRNVLLYGDSLLAPIKEFGPSVLLTNECKYGMSLQDALDEEDRLIGISMLLDEDKYDVLFICLGANDIGKGCTTEEMEKNINQLCKIILEHSNAPKKGVYWIALSHLPLPLLSLDERVQLLSCVAHLKNGHLSKKGLDCAQKLLYETCFVR